MDDESLVGRGDIGQYKKEEPLPRGFFYGVFRWQVEGAFVINFYI